MSRAHCDRRLRADTDRAFDRLFPSHLRRLSPTFWTPVGVAVRACALLAPTDGMRVLDLGAGAGKLCAIGALSSSSMWCGVEQHGALVETARALSSTLGVGARTMFVHGDMFSLDWTLFDALYLYNPFRPPLYLDEGRAHELDTVAQIAQVQTRLARMPRGTRLVTLHGFGGHVPPSYELVYQELVAGSNLVLWVQGRSGSSTA